MQEHIFLELKSVSVSFGGRLLLDNVSLSLPYRQWMLFLGPNGSGKTTLLRLISGRLQSWQGQLIVEGKSYTQLTWNACKAYKHGIAMVEQVPEFPEDVFAWEYLLWGLPYEGNSFFLEKEKVILQLEKKLFFTNKFKFELRLRICDLSLSDRFKLCVASALLRARNLVLWDESIIFLGHEEKNFLPDLIHSLTFRGLSTLIVTHEPLSWTGEVKSSFLLQDKMVKLISKYELKDCIGYPRRANLPATTKKRSVVFEAVTNHGCLKVHQGEIVGLLADSEIPLREWENFLWGLDSIVKGKISLQGEDISNKNFNERRESMAWIVPILGARDEPAICSLVLPFLFKKNSSLGKTLFIKKLHSNSFARSILPAYLWSRLSTPWGKLSGGERQAIILSRELANNPSFMIASFATQGLDKKSVEFFWQKMQDIVFEKQGSLLLLMTEEREAQAFCETIYTLNNLSLSSRENAK